MNMRKIVVIVAIIINLFSGVAIAGEQKWFEVESWDKTDYLLLGTLVTFTIIDWGQTRYIASNSDRFNELSPLLGDHPSIGKVNRHFVMSSIAIVGVAMILPSKYRKLFLGATAILEIGVTAHNRSIGIGMKF